MDLQKLLFSLSETSCITGAGTATNVVFDTVKRFAPDTFRDPLGNIIAPVKKAKEGRPHILLEAHMDEIGFVVQTIDDDGFVHIGKVGGPDIRVLLGSEVTIFGKEPVYGVFCCRPPHLSSNDDYKKVPELDELAIDIGYTHDKAVEKVSPGDYITLRQAPAELINGLITGKALDNRAGVATVLRCLELCAEKVDCGLTAAFTLSEELGCRGAVTASYTAAPTHAIVVDVSFGYTPDAPKEKCGKIGRGPMIGISPVLSGEVTSVLFEAAKANNIPYQTEVMGGETGTNADSVSISRGGVATGLVSVPLRYMHTAVETIAVSDVENTARLMAAAVEQIGGGKNV
ncbi:M42 family peptidase [[Clostridium] cellulosi]